MEIRQSQLDIINRISRLLIGAGLIGATMAAPAIAGGPLGYLSFLPLLAVYPLLTGLLGEDPVDGLLARWIGGVRDHRLRPSSRVALLVAGTGTIGFVLANPQVVTSLGWLSLAGIYPIMLGLFGEDLLLAAIKGARRADSYEPIQAQPVVGIKHRTTRVRQDDFRQGGERTAA